MDAVGGSAGDDGRMAQEERPTWPDVVVAGAAAVFAVVFLFIDGGNRSNADPAMLVAGVAGALTLLVRRRFPLLVLLAVVTARIVVVMGSGSDQVLLPAVMVALYTMASLRNRSAGLGIGIAVGVGQALVVAALGREPELEEFLGEIALAALPLAVGEAFRGRAERLRTRIDTEAEARVQAERLAIARDLHDVVAHALSGITVQAGVAAHLLDRDPDQARQALERINGAGRTALEDLRDMVGSLRTTDEAPRRPVLTDPNDLRDVVAGAEANGVPLTVEVTGAFPAGVPDAVPLAVHRIIQEGLTNVARHGGAAPTTLRIEHRPDGVEVRLRNEAPSQARVDAPTSTGVGVIGMTERAQALGGTLRAVPTDDGGFELMADIPYGRPSSLS
ncbi:MAG: histidine kinase [Actinomycetota bacterium]